MLAQRNCVSCSDGTDHRPPLQDRVAVVLSMLFLVVIVAGGIRGVWP